MCIKLLSSKISVIVKQIDLLPGVDPFCSAVCLPCHCLSQLRWVHKCHLVQPYSLCKVWDCKSGKNDFKYCDFLVHLIWKQYVL
jgi:hypothetical protein